MKPKASYWNQTAKRHEERPDIEAFLVEIQSVCQKHKIRIYHEDNQGCFELVTETDVISVGDLKPDTD